MYMMVFILHCWFLFYIFFQKKNQTDKKIENGEGGMSSRALGFFRDKCHPCHCGHHQNQFHRDSSSFKFTFEKLFLKNKNNLIRTIINHIPVSDHFVSFLSKVLLQGIEQTFKYFQEYGFKNITSLVQVLSKHFHEREILTIMLLLVHREEWIH